MSDNTTYWTHNTAYHNWILSHAKSKNQVLDVGCGDGLLVERLSQVCGHVTGIDTHTESVEKAKERLINTVNTSIINIGFEDYDIPANSLDLIVFVASLHHMEQELCIKKAKTLLAPNGKLLVVGCTSPQGFTDWCIQIVRIFPARIGSFFHGAITSENIGVPTVKPNVSLSDIKTLANRELLNAKIRQGLYYRYLLSWTKSN